MASEQQVKQVWATPTHGEIVALTKQHVGAMETMDIDMVWVQAGMHHVLLSTVGRKSGVVHKVALPVWLDSNGVRVVVASFAGATKHPSWFVNLADAGANPEVLCRVQHGSFWSVPQVLLGGDEHTELWSQLVEDRAWYATYQAKTERTIPLVRLPESRPA